MESKARERLLFEANLYLANKATHPWPLDGVRKGIEPWETREEYRLIELVEGGWDKGFGCIEDVDDFLAGPGYQELIARNELVKQEFERFVAEKKASKLRRLPRSPETILSSTKFLEYTGSRKIETLNPIELDEAIRLNNEWLAANSLDSVDFKAKCRRSDVRVEWKQSHIVRAALAMIVYLHAEYRRGSEYARAWLFIGVARDRTRIVSRLMIVKCIDEMNRFHDCADR